MRTIAAIASKGGPGKTTLLFALGNEAAKESRVFFADLDPQSSLNRLCDIRSRRGDADASNPLLLENALNIEDVKEKLAGTEFDRDYLFTDTPGSMVKIIRHAVASADAILIPVRASALDMMAQDDAFEIVREMGKASKTVFALNAVDMRWGVDDAVKAIEKRFQSTPVVIGLRAAYVRAHIHGKSGAEIDAKCQTEIAALWARVKQAMKGD